MATRKGRTPGNAIRAYLERQQLSQQDFADRLEVSQALVSAWVNGAIAVSPEKAKRIEELTGIPRLALLYPDERAA